LLPASAGRGATARAVDFDGARRYQGPAGVGPHAPTIAPDDRPHRSRPLRTPVSLPRLCVVAAAGSGQRLHPRSARVPKVMLEVGGKPLLTRQLELVRDALGIRRVQVIVGWLADHLRAHYGDGRGLGLELSYIENPDFDRGLGTALVVAEPHVHEPFLFLLGDEVYLESNHAELRALPDGWTAVCGLVRTDDPDVVAKNYAVTVENGRITGLREKPPDPAGDWAGCGTYMFTPEVFRWVRDTPLSPRSGKLELTDVIDRAARGGAPVLPFEVRGRYLNVNTIEDLNAANYLCRSLHFERHRVSVVIPTYDEADSIGAVVRDFQDQAHEIVVMDNQSPDGTADIARRLGATVHSRPLRGYGDACRQGLDAATGDILVLVEADATFRAKDLPKFLEYLKDADMVIGTRTTRQMIEQGANMDGLLRWGNLFVGKLVEALWWEVEPRYTDVGCTYRAIWADAWHKIRRYMTSDGAPFSPEMMIEMMRAKGRVVEIPVSYYRRKGGHSKHSASRWQSARTGLKMLRLIMSRRLNLS
jgi:UDP-N-acetylglucosamine diphosphorylase / glucose-1-phosphate thymidylyltransferase / UDP-N-acetylgalactosamine diphosphorylase / glucosamine-1-phosphate N-acetyltransferase / galactosamine-1-phosphate N-acetyltransferase